MDSFIWIKKERSLYGYWEETSEKDVYFALKTWKYDLRTIS
jgi:hypothetical protein